jgi:hypothetical protein
MAAMHSRRGHPSLINPSLINRAAVEKVAKGRSAKIALNETPAKPELFPAANADS